MAKGRSAPPPAFNPNAPVISGSPLPPFTQPKPVFAPLPNALKKLPEAPPEERVEPEPVQRYRVVSGGSIMTANGLTNLKTGKVIDPRMYNIENLRNQGIVLEPLK
jgi:hypothetical protein